MSLFLSLLKNFPMKIIPATISVQWENDQIWKVLTPKGGVILQFQSKPTGTHGGG